MAVGSFLVVFVTIATTCLVPGVQPMLGGTLSVDLLSDAKTIATALSPMKVDEFVFLPSVTSLEEMGPLFLGGAGARGIEINGKFTKVTAIAVYLGKNSTTSLSPKWKGKSVDYLMNHDAFFHDIITGPFVKLTEVRMILPLTGKEYAAKVTENCITHWKATGRYTQAEAKAVSRFREVFEHEQLPHGFSIFFEQSACGNNLRVGFSKDGTVPEKWHTVENRQMATAVLESIIGQGGVSPEARKSLAERISKFMH